MSHQLFITSGPSSPTMRLGALEKQVLEEGRLWMAEELERECRGESQREGGCIHTAGGPLNTIWPASPISVRVMPAGINVNQSAGICK